MPRELRESDWKLLRELGPRALDHLCERVLSELTRIAADSEKTHHERYRAVYKLIQDRDKEVAAAFNRPRCISWRECAHWDF